MGKKILEEGNKNKKSSVSKIKKSNEGKRGYKKCKNNTCGQLIHIHLKICTFCGEVNKMKDKRKKKINKDAIMEILRKDPKSATKVTKKEITALRSFFKILILKDEHLLSEKISEPISTQSSPANKPNINLLDNSKNTIPIIEITSIKRDELNFSQKNFLKTLLKEIPNENDLEFNKEQYNLKIYLKLNVAINSLAFSYSETKNETLLYVSFYSLDKTENEGSMPNFGLDQATHKIQNLPLIGRIYKGQSYILLLKLNTKNKLRHSLDTKSLISLSSDSREIKIIKFVNEGKIYEKLAVVTLDGFLTVYTYSIEDLQNSTKKDSLLQFDKKSFLQNPSSQNFTTMSWVDSNWLLIGNETGHIYLVKIEETKLKIQKSWNSFSNFGISKIVLCSLDQPKTISETLFAYSTMDGVIKLQTVKEKITCFELTSLSVKIVLKRNL